MPAAQRRLRLRAERGEGEEGQRISERFVMDLPGTVVEIAPRFARCVPQRSFAPAPQDGARASATTLDARHQAQGPRARRVPTFGPTRAHDGPARRIDRMSLRRRPQPRAARPRRAGGARSRCTSPTACRASRSSAWPTPRSRRRASACAPRCRRAASSSRTTSASRSTSRRPTCRRNRAASTCRSRSASSPPPGRSTPARLGGFEFAGELSLGRRAAPGARRAGDGAGAARSAGDDAAHAGAAARPAPTRRRSVGGLAVRGADHLLDVVRALLPGDGADASGAARSRAAAAPRGAGAARPARRARARPAPSARSRSPRPAATAC